MAEPKTFHIDLSPGAERDLKAFSPEVQRTISKQIQNWLNKEPFKEIKTRIKRLSGFVPSLYRLRIGDYRAYYRIAGDRVAILGIVHKKDSEHWLRRI
ncbi:MAG: type II toxin-antitoxin system RelE family toxin [Candidatus Binatia bacterium]